MRDGTVPSRRMTGFGRRGRLKKTHWYAAALAAVMLAVVIVYLLASSAGRADYDSLAMTGGMDCPWLEIDCENLSEDEERVYDVFYSALADLKYPEPVCREISQFYVYNYAACADEPTIDEIRHENDRLCIKSSGNMNFAFSVDSSVRTIWNLNTGKIIYAVVE